MQGHSPGVPGAGQAGTLLPSGAQPGLCCDAGAASALPTGDWGLAELSEQTCLERCDVGITLLNQEGQPQSCLIPLPWVVAGASLQSRGSWLCPRRAPEPALTSSSHSPGRRERAALGQSQNIPSWKGPQGSSAAPGSAWDSPRRGDSRSLGLVHQRHWAVLVLSPPLGSVLLFPAGITTVRCKCALGMWLLLHFSYWVEKTHPCCCPWWGVPRSCCPAPVIQQRSGCAAGPKMATFIKQVPKCALPLKTASNGLPACSWCCQTWVLCPSGDVSGHVL